MQIGFQNRDPRTDFRAGGLLSLLSLFYLAKYRSHDFELMRRSCEEKGDFFIAVSSINLTSHLMSYLHMNDSRSMPASHDRRAPRLQFKLFAELLSQSKLTFFELNSLAFVYLFHFWRLRTNQMPKGT